MYDDRATGQWRRDGVVLAQIGADLARQVTEVEVRLPRSLADQAVAAWQRDDGAPEGPAGESAEERAVRHRAAALALIGLALEDRGQEDGDEVVVRLNAWFVGDALNAADEAGLIT